MNKRISIRNNEVIIDGETPEITITNNKFNVNNFSLNGNYEIDAYSLSLLIAAYTDASVYSTNYGFCKDKYSFVTKETANKAVIENKDHEIFNSGAEIAKLNSELLELFGKEKELKKYIDYLYNKIETHNKKSFINKIEIDENKNKL